MSDLLLTMHERDIGDLSSESHVAENIRVIPCSPSWPREAKAVRIILTSYLFRLQRSE